LAHLGLGPGVRAIRAGSIGRDMAGRGSIFFIRRRGRGVSSRLIRREITALGCQANCPGFRAFASR